MWGDEICLVLPSQTNLRYSASTVIVMAHFVALVVLLPYLIGPLQ